MRKHSLSIVVSVITVLIFSFSANAKRGGHKGKWHKEIFQQLDLTDEQKGKLKEIRKAKKEIMKSIRQKKKDQRQKLIAAMKGDASDGELKSLHSEMQKIRNQMGDHRFETMLKIRKILTKEQRVKFAELRERQKKHRGGHMHDEDE